MFWGSLHLVLVKDLMLQLGYHLVATDALLMPDELRATCRRLRGNGAWYTIEVERLVDA